ncbi:uncharacterized protein LOC143208623 [Lasioglossum baleicum]|uniref:uncharacterized protein LOC143208623 n=1 Tax=Lasioglossum baleicum TaxID=434251 RepID=UPI003FCCE810
MKSEQFSTSASSRTSATVVSFSLSFYMCIYCRYILCTVAFIVIAYGQYRAALRAQYFYCCINKSFIRNKKKQEEMFERGTRSRIVSRGQESSERSLKCSSSMERDTKNGRTRGGRRAHGLTGSRENRTALVPHRASPLSISVRTTTTTTTTAGRSRMTLRVEANAPQDFLREARFGRSRASRRIGTKVSANYILSRVPRERVVIAN